MKLPSESQCDFYAIIWHPDRNRILVTEDHRGTYDLPHWVDERIRWQAANRVVPMVESLLGIPTIVLRCVSVGNSPQNGRGSFVYELEALSAAESLKPDTRWVDQDELQNIILHTVQGTCPPHDMLQGVTENRIPENRVPWARSGWFSDAVCWIQAQLRQTGAEQSGPVEQIHTRQRGCVLRVSTSKGCVYFKASPPFFPHEVGLTAWLARRCTRNCPCVLAYDVERRWILTREIVGDLLDTVQDVAAWETALRTYAKLQIKCSQHVDKLVALGCPDRRLHILKDHVDVLLDDPSSLQVGRLAFSDAEIEKLRDEIPLLKRACDKLAEYKIPASIEHRDFAAFNIIVSEEEPVFFDWSEASVTHPFLGSVAFSQRIEGYGVDLGDFRKVQGPKLDESYLGPWQECESEARLVEALELSRPLSALHYALSSKLFVLPSIETRWEEENMFVYYARMILDYGDQLVTAVS